MKIFLYRPNSEILMALPPLGLMSLAAYLRKHGDHDIRIYDGRLHCSNHAEIAAQAEDFKPDVVGVGVLSLERQVGHQSLMYIRKALPKVTTVMGGPYPSASPADALENSDLDFIVQGEGEVVAQNLITALEKSGDFSSIKGMGYRNNGNVAVAAREEPIPDLDSLPMTAWDMINLPDYHTGKGRMVSMNFHKKYEESVPYLTSRGCPFSCTYCTNYFGRKARLRGVDSIMNELTHLISTYGIKEIEFVDDAFNLNLKRAKGLFRRVIDEKINLVFSFPNGLRADAMDEELVDLMKQAGVYRVIYAVESGSPRIQKAIQKHLNLEKTQKMITYSAKKGLSVGTFYMMGFLDETEEEMRQTINFALKSKAHTASFYLLNPWPHTELYNQALQAGHQLDNIKLIHYYTLPVNITKVPDDRILKLRNMAYRRFFLNPFRVYHFFRTTPSRKYFFTKVVIATILFFAQMKEEKKSDIGEQATEGVYKQNLAMRWLFRRSGLDRLENDLQLKRSSDLQAS